ncbi:MAG: hypothetical protein JWP13_484 [Candidatus Saccharibacteria bacterium]|nr:hypothetical protein [Candidatus Saccharibacteria bacterium]
MKTSTKKYVSGGFLIGMLALLVAIPAAFYVSGNTVQSLVIVGLALVSIAMLAALVATMTAEARRQRDESPASPQSFSESASSVIEILFWLLVVR